MGVLIARYTGANNEEAVNRTAVQAFITGQREETEFGDQYFRIAPRLETGDPRYAWVNQTLFVAEGRGYAGYGVEYRVYRVS